MTQENMQDVKNQQAYMVVGNDNENNQRALVGIAASCNAAEKIVGEDYMALLVAKKLSPITERITRAAGTDSDTVYSAVGYSWHLVPIQFDTLLNFAL